MHTIASNAGVEGAVVVGKLLEQDNPDLGYDAAKGLLSFSTNVFSIFLPSKIGKNYWYVNALGNFCRFPLSSCLSR